MTLSIEMRIKIHRQIVSNCLRKKTRGTKLRFSVLEHLDKTWHKNNPTMPIREGDAYLTHTNTIIKLMIEPTLGNKTECAICFETMTEHNAIQLNCAHSFCANCIYHVISLTKHAGCSLCRTTINMISIPNRDLLQDISDYMYASS